MEWRCVRGGTCVLWGWSLSVARALILSRSSHKHGETTGRRVILFGFDTWLCSSLRLPGHVDAGRGGRSDGEKPIPLLLLCASLLTNVLVPVTEFWGDSSIVIHLELKSPCACAFVSF